MRYDIAIVGSGPAGLSAAINAKIRNKNIIVFGTESLSNKLIKAPSIDNYLGFYEISGEELREKFQDHLDKMEIEITYKKINNNRIKDWTSVFYTFLCHVFRWGHQGKANDGLWLEQTLLARSL